MKKALLRYLGYMSFAALTAYALLYFSGVVPDKLLLDFTVDQYQTSEFSPVEQLQHAFLLVCSVIFFWIASRDRLRRPMAIGWATLFMLFLVRELDYVFDTYLADNVWEAVSAVILAFSGVYIYRHSDRFVNGWRRSWPSAGLGIALGGLILLVPFTQVVVSSTLWAAVMDENYVRAAKVAAEELMELGAYLLMLIGSVEFMYSWSRLPQTRLIGALPKRKRRQRKRRS